MLVAYAPLAKYNTVPNVATNGMLMLWNPATSEVSEEIVSGNLASFNVPADRLLSEVKSINEALDDRNTSYQRIALALGYRTWDVNVKNEEQDLMKAIFKEIKKEKSKIKAAQTREIKKQKEADAVKAMTPEQRKAYNNKKYRKRVEAARKAAETRRKNRSKG